MAGDQQQLTVDGQAVLQADLNPVFREAALADDAVFAELLNLPAFNSADAVGKAILARRNNGAALVAPNNATGSVYVEPFRAVIGSRTAVSSTAGTPFLNWADVRSRVFAQSGDNTDLGLSQAFVANTSGQPRWDLLCVKFEVDQNSAQVTRNVRAPGTPATQAPVPTLVVPSLTQVVSLVVVEGTAGASPVPPAPPSDAGSTFYIPLAAVLIPNGFGGTTVVLPGWIHMLAPVAQLPASFGAGIELAPSGLSSGLSNAALEAWGAASERPTQYIPCTRQGGVKMRFGLDCTSSTPLLGDTAILDATIDWRRRDFTVRCDTWAGATQFAWQTGATTGAIPKATPATSLTTPGQSFIDDSAANLGGIASRNGGVVFFANNAVLSTIAAGSNAFGLYVDRSTGALRVYYLGTPGQLLHLTVEASDAYDNA